MSEVLRLLYKPTKLSMSNSKREDRINFLARKWKSGSITDEEMHEFEHWYHSFNDSQKTVDHYASEDDLKQKIYKGIEKKIQDDTRKALPISKILYRKWHVAASVLFLMSMGIIFTYYHSDRTRAENPSVFPVQTVNQYDVMPGGDKAVLLLSDGRSMVLDDDNSVSISDATGNRITSDGKKLIFQSNEIENTTTNKISYSTIVTPSSGQFQVVLPDGSHVWLNAESSLRFPNRFEDRREVVLTGEAYFEVAKDANKPFKVITDGQQVEVLGTHFNIGAYADEDEVKTTLLEGSVKLIAGNNSVLLRPGQEAVTPTNSDASDKIVLRESNLQQTIAWKNGLFDFKDADIGVIMRSIARWYNVEIEYRNNDTNRKFSGRIYRNINLQEALSILNYSGINTVLEQSVLPDKSGKITVL